MIVNITWEIVLKKNLFYIFLFFMIFTNTVLAVCNGTKESPCTVQDTENNTPTLKYWRTTQMLADSYQGDITGLKDLMVSGSCQPSQQGLKTLLNEIKKASNGRAKNIIDVDLRQESHGYLNKDAINLTVQYDWINLGKTLPQILADEMKWLNFIKTQSNIYILTPKQFKSGDFLNGKYLPVQKINTEKELAEASGFQYVRLVIPDHMAPGDAEVDQFVNLVKNAKSDTWLHLHCRGGEGRTTTFLAMYDMLKNANKVSFNEIIKRQAAVAPFYDLFQVNRENSKLTSYYKERLNFLRQFYEFSKDSLNGFSGNWSQWKNIHRVKSQ